jgi:hypothetical protein|eukprot:COSAG06_NODE_4022_length_4652_cov_6.927520_4_plen_146_part_00
MEVSAFMTEQLKEQRAHDEEIRHEMEAKMDELRQQTAAQIEEQRQHFEAKLLAKAQEQSMSDLQTRLEVLQARLEALHASDLLSDTELFTFEDCIGDFVRLRASKTPDIEELRATANKLAEVVGVSEGMSRDAMCARQLRRHFLQ